MMTPEQSLSTITMLADAGIAQARQIQELQEKLNDSERALSNCRVALQNIGGMALDQFPELAETCDRHRDPYELIRQAFIKMAQVTGRRQ